MADVAAAKFYTSSVCKINYLFMLKQLLQFFTTTQEITNTLLSRNYSEILLTGVPLFKENIGAQIYFCII